MEIKSVFTREKFMEEFKKLAKKDKFVCFTGYGAVFKNHVLMFDKSVQ